MPVEREAFARAWRFLNYKPMAKWIALAAAVTTGILYIALLLLLSLFVDLLVQRGRIPSFRELSRSEQESFDAAWSRGLDADARRERLEAIGIDKGPAADYENTDPVQLTPSEQELLWRAYLYRLLRDQVGPGAAVIVLPDYHALPPRVREAFQLSWQDLPARERRERLESAGRAEIALATRDLAQLNAAEWELLWRVHLRRFLEEKENSALAATYWQDRLSHDDGAADSEQASQRELADRGILSLLVRTHNQPVQRVLGVVARLVPLTWRDGRGTFPNYLYYLTGLLAAALVLVVLRGLAMFVMHLAAAQAVSEASHRLRRAVYHHTFRLGTLAFRALGPGEAVGIFTNQVVAVEHGLHSFLIVDAREPVKFVLLLALALVLNPLVSVTFLLFALLVWLIGGQVAASYRRQERAAVRQSAEQLALLQESLMLMRLVKSYMMELFNQSRVERQLAAYSASQMRHYRGEAVARPVLVFLGTLAAAALLYVTGLLVLGGHLGVARVITLAAVLASLYGPLVNWLEHRRVARRARKAAGILFQFLDRPGEVGQVVGAEFLPPLHRELRFDNVSLREPGTGRKLLENVSLTIEAGQRVALVGPEEMEKHALVYLIPRFLDPSAGEIQIDQHNLRWVTLDSLRAQIAIVLHHNMVFNDTVANNIGCGDSGYDLPKIIEAAKVAHAHHFIQKLPQGYETPIGELGHPLNTGEMFRIALARAILRDPAVLIVEEPATVLDDDTKAMVDDTFSRVLPGRTVIFLPHRISTIRSCDRVFLLHKGRLEAAGDHRELLAQSDLYRHLQYIEFNVFADLV
jgi:ATP-binding cassette subfamily B protein